MLVTLPWPGMGGSSRCGRRSGLTVVVLLLLGVAAWTKSPRSYTLPWGTCDVLLGIIEASSSVTLCGPPCSPTVF